MSSLLISAYKLTQCVIQATLHVVLRDLTNYYWTKEREEIETQQHPVIEENVDDNVESNEISYAILSYPDESEILYSELEAGSLLNDIESLAQFDDILDATDIQTPDTRYTFKQLNDDAEIEYNQEIENVLTNDITLSEENPVHINQEFRTEILQSQLETYSFPNDTTQLDSSLDTTDVTFPDTIYTFDLLKDNIENEEHNQEKEKIYAKDILIFSEENTVHINIEDGTEILNSKSEAKIFPNDDTSKLSNCLVTSDITFSDTRYTFDQCKANIENEKQNQAKEKIYAKDTTIFSEENTVHINIEDGTEVLNSKSEAEIYPNDDTSKLSNFLETSDITFTDTIYTFDQLKDTIENEQLNLETEREHVKEVQLLSNKSHSSFDQEIFMDINIATENYLKTLDENNNFSSISNENLELLLHSENEIVFKNTEDNLSVPKIIENCQELQSRLGKLICQNTFQPQVPQREIHSIGEPIDNTNPILEAQPTYKHGDYRSNINCMWNDKEKIYESATSLVDETTNNMVVKSNVISDVLVHDNSSYSVIKYNSIQDCEHECWDQHACSHACLQYISSEDEDEFLSYEQLLSDDQLESVETGSVFKPF